MGNVISLERNKSVKTVRIHFSLGPYLHLRIRVTDKNKEMDLHGL